MNRPEVGPVTHGAEWPPGALVGRAGVQVEEEGEGHRNRGVSLQERGGGRTQWPLEVNRWFCPEVSLASAPGVVTKPLPSPPHARSLLQLLERQICSLV